jgi:hypothetical protein
MYHILVFFFLGITSHVAELDLLLSSHKNISCALFLAPSTISRGSSNGIFAGTHFSSNETIEELTAIEINTKLIMHWQLFDVVIESDRKGNSLILYGSAMQANDDHKGNVEFEWADDTAPHKLYATSTIEPGDELVTGFGRDSRYNCSEKSIHCRKAYDLDQLKQVGHCISHLYLSNSSLPEVNEGVFSKVSYKKGDVVSISPIVILPKHSVLNISNSSSVDLINYCLVSPGNSSDVALFPIGLMGRANHGGKAFNVRIDWHNWSTSSSLLSHPINDLESLNYPPLNIQYIATRDIAQGEEITLYYGKDWAIDWRAYQRSKDSWRRGLRRISEEDRLRCALTSGASQNSEGDEDENVVTSVCAAPDAPLFRRAIEVDIFPPNFDSICIGRLTVECNVMINEYKISKDPRLQRLRDEAKGSVGDLLKRIRAVSTTGGIKKSISGEQIGTNNVDTCSSTTTRRMN